MRAGLLSFAIVSLSLTSVFATNGTAQEPSAEQAVSVRKLEAAGAKIVYRDGKVLRVSFRGTKATGQSILPAVELKQFLSLDLTDCPISDDNLAALVPISLGQIQLAGTRVTDAGMEHLAKIRTLALVNVERTQVGDDGLANLVTLPQLGDLWIADTKVTDTGLAKLNSAQNIWRLSIGGRSVRDESLKHLTGLKKLSGLRVQSERVTETGLQTLLAAPKLRQVTLLDSQVPKTKTDELRRTRPNLRVLLQRSPGRVPTRTSLRTVAGNSSSNGKTARPQNTATKPKRPQQDPRPRPVTPAPSTSVSQQEAIAKLKSFGAELEMRGSDVIRIDFTGNKSHLGDQDFSFLPALTSLEKLDLSQTSVTDATLRRLGGLRRLQTVWLYQTDVTWEGITELEGQIPRIKVFATPPNQKSAPWVGWIVAAALPAFLFTGYSFVRAILSQFGHVAQLTTDAQSGKQLDRKSLMNQSGGRHFCNAAMGFATFFMLIGGSFLVSGTGEAMKSSSAANWPTVEGEVTVSRVNRRSTTDSDGHSSTAYDPIVVYHYEVDGTKHTSSRLATYRVANFTAETIDQQFPIGPVTVHYNPADAADAVLLTGVASDSYIPIGLGGVATLIGVVIFLVALIKRRRFAKSDSGKGSGWKFSFE